MALMVGMAAAGLRAATCPALAASLSPNEFATLAEQCAPAVPAETLRAVAKTESDLDPWALHNDTTGQIETPNSFDLAAELATQWVRSGDSVDIGLMQINTENFSALHMTIDTALDPCASLAGGAAVLRAAYGGGNTPVQQQAALLMALSRYNTGSPFAGIMNGYARAVTTNAVAEILPAPESDRTTPLDVDPNAPPAWNISESGAYAQSHGAAWLIDLAPSQVSRLDKQFVSAGFVNFSISTTTR